jgi:hypothetical protein
LRRSQTPHEKASVTSGETMNRDLLLDAEKVRPGKAGMEYGDASDVFADEPIELL